jgi:hypothetical protein
VGAAQRGEHEDHDDATARDKLFGGDTHLTGTSCSSHDIRLMPFVDGSMQIEPFADPTA